MPLESLFLTTQLNDRNNYRFSRFSITKQQFILPTFYQNAALPA